MKKTLPIILVFIFTLACSLVSPPATPQSDEGYIATTVSLTTEAMLTQITPPTVPAPPATQISPTLTDEELIRQALLIKLGWTAAELDFSMGNNTGTVANGTVKKVNDMAGAAWFAGKNSSGDWVIAYIGQGIPYCSEIQAFSFPTDWISHCMDASDNVIER